MATKKNIASIAKKNNKKNTENHKKDDKKSVDDETKERIDRLVDEIGVSTNKSDNDLLEISEESSNNIKGDIEWLQEQLTKLSDENEKLKKEAIEAKESYKKIYSQYENVKKGSNGTTTTEKMVPDSELKNSIIELFFDIQNNFLGKNPERRRYKQIIPVPFMNKMIKYFPFLSEHKKY